VPSYRRRVASTPSSQSFPKRLRLRVALGLVVGFAGCTVYDQALLDSAVGTGGSGGRGTGGGATGGGATGGGATGGGATGGGATGGQGGTTGGSGGVSVAGSTAGGVSGRGGAGSGGSDPSGGTGAMEGGSNGDGGEGDQGSGGSSGAGLGGGGAGGGGTGGTGGTSGAGAGGVGGASGAGTGGAGGTSGAGTGGAGGAGTGGTGGAGAGGTGGAGAGGTGGAGAGGTGGAGAGGAGSGGTGEVCTGCARLSVALDAADERAHYCLTLSGLTDFSAATITFRVARLAGTGGEFLGYIQHGGTPDYLYVESAHTQISSIGTSLSNIVWDVSTVTGTFDKTVIARIGIEVTSEGSSAWTNPTVLYIDSVTVTGSNPAIAAWTFDTSATVYTTPVNSYGTGPIWLNNYSADTTAAGSAISWLGP